MHILDSSWKECRQRSHMNNIKICYHCNCYRIVYWYLHFNDGEVIREGLECPFCVYICSSSCSKYIGWLSRALGTLPHWLPVKVNLLNPVILPQAMTSVTADSFSFGWPTQIVFLLGDPLYAKNGINYTGVCHVTKVTFTYDNHN